VLSQDDRVMHLIYGCSESFECA